MVRDLKDADIADFQKFVDFAVGQGDAFGSIQCADHAEARCSANQIL